MMNLCTQENTNASHHKEYCVKHFLIFCVKWKRMLTFVFYISACSPFAIMMALNFMYIHLICKIFIKSGLIGIFISKTFHNSIEPISVPYLLDRFIRTLINLQIIGTMITRTMPIFNIFKLFTYCWLKRFNW